MASEATLGIRVNIIQCGSLEHIEEACLRDERCCVFIAPAAGIEAAGTGGTITCETWEVGDGAADMCYEQVVSGPAPRE